MSVPFGIDFGNYSSVLGVARNRGIDVVVNEVSNRATPSLVGFGSRCRYLGEAAKSTEISNLKNTTGSLKRILGRRGNDPDLLAEKSFISAQLLDRPQDPAGLKVKYLNKDAEFSSVQLAAMYFRKLKSTAERELKTTMTDVVVAVPVWYSEAQRRAAADAAIIAGLNPVRIVNDVTAAAVGYGVFRPELPEDKPKYVAIVDVGHSSVTVSINAFKKGELKVVSSAYNKEFGGRVLDLAIANHFKDVFKEKYRIDISTNPKAFYRVLTAAEKLKKILSANSTAPFNVESVMDDIDVSSSMTREELEEYIRPQVEKLGETVEAALKDAKISADDLDAVEVIGGTSRVPCIKEKLTHLFGKQLSYTMNQDEAVARGCAFICAIHSPTVRVRPFKFEDVNPHSVTFFWDPQEEDTGELEVFTKGGSFPSTKMVTLFRKEDFDIEARYTHPEELPAGTSPWIGKWSLKGIKPAENGDAVAVKIKLRQDPSGFYTVDSAYTAEEVVVTPEPSANDKEGENKEAEEPPRKTECVKKDTLKIVHSHLGVDEATRNQFIELENEMAAEDKLVADTEDRKNALEEYIYDIRSKIDDLYVDFASDEEKQKIRERADAAEEWLYNDGEDATKAQYIAKYEEIASIGNLVRGRYLSKIEEERQQKLAAKEAEEQRKMAAKLQEERAAKEAEEAEKPQTTDEPEDAEMDANDA